jgi:hypothetical protein
MMAPLFYLRNLSTRDRIEAGLAGQPAELYQPMLHEISAQLISFGAVLMKNDRAV